MSVLYIYLFEIEKVLYINISENGQHCLSHYHQYLFMMVESRRHVPRNIFTAPIMSAGVVCVVLCLPSPSNPEYFS